MASVPPADRSDLDADLEDLAADVVWHRDGDVRWCALSSGTATVEPGANGGWQVDRVSDGVVVDRRDVHDGLDGSAAAQIVDVVRGWGA